MSIEMSDTDQYRSNKDSSQVAIKRLKNLRAGKKRSITIRIKRLSEEMNNEVGRTKAQYLLDALCKVFEEAKAHHKEMTDLIDENDRDGEDEWLEDLRLQIDDCYADVMQYLEDRKHLPPSIVGSEKVFNLSTNSPGRSCRSMIDQFQTLQVSSKEFADSSHLLSAEQSKFKDIQTWRKDINQTIDAEANRVRHNACGISVTLPEDNVQVIDKKPRLTRPPTLTDHQIARQEPIDSWIDNLDYSNATFCENEKEKITAAEITMQWAVYQNLPKRELPSFDGAADQWIDFIVKFKEMVHDQFCLSATQKFSYLLQHVNGEAERSIKGFSYERIGYVLALKRLKYMFGQPAKVAHAHINKVTRGKPLTDNDNPALYEFYFAISELLITLNRMCYYSDLYSTDILRQVIRRLPPRLQNKWMEKSFVIRKSEEPNLTHLEKWLQDRIMAQRDPYMPTHSSREDRRKPYKTLMTRVDKRKPTNQYKGKQDRRSNQLKNMKCKLCSSSTHRLSQCEIFKSKNINERTEIVKKNGLCYNCLSDKHKLNGCNSKYTCFKDNCSLRHHTLLHKESQVVKADSEVSEEKKLTLTHTKVNDSYVYLQVVPVQVKSKHGTNKATYALIDGGSQATLIREDFAKELGMVGEPTNINLSTIKDKGESIDLFKVELEFSPVTDNDKKFVNKNVLTIPKYKFFVPNQTLPNKFSEDKDYAHMHGLGLNNIKAEDIKLLLGADMGEAIVSLEVKIGNPGIPLAVRTIFGWTLMGSLQTKGLTQPKMVNLLKSNDETLQKTVEEFWTTESFGTKFTSIKEMSIEDTTALKRLETETKVINEQYVIPMLWKNGKPNFPDGSYSVAKKRLQYVISKLNKNENLRQMYNTQIESYIANGYAEEITEDKRNQNDERIWYLPHHAVTNRHKPGKVRVVFDAAAKIRNQSLNTELLTGPDLMNSLIGVIIRFRSYPIVLMADVEAMFHRVNVDEDDKDALRFLWKENGFEESQLKEYRMVVHIFGAKDSCCAATYALHKVTEEFANEISPMTIDAIKRNFYVDDLLKSLATISMAKTLATEVRELLSKRNFKLTKFYSNYPEVLENIPKEAVTEPKVELEFDSQTERALGVRWNIEDEVFQFKRMSLQTPATKRGILKLVSSIFDPLGFLSPVTLKGKTIIQDLWRQRYDWDTKLPDVIVEEWEVWLSTLKMMPMIKIPRCFLRNGIDYKSIDLHIFTDASEKAFGAVAYLRVTYDSQKPTISLLMSKSRLAPIKTLTIPRMELQAAVLGVRLKETLLAEIDLPIQSTKFWSDSLTTLQYINNEHRRFKTFVSNRVQEIREKSEPEDWHHIPGIKNPADLITRHNDVSSLIDNDVWLNGPPFLSEHKVVYPAHIQIKNLINDPEMKKIQINSIGIQEQNFDLRNIIEFDNYSSWNRLLRVTAWINRFRTNLLSTVRNSIKTIGTLTVQELKLTERIIIKSVQRNHFKVEIESCINKSKLPRNSPLKSLNPFIDENEILRIGGRLRNADISFDAKHQVILPKRHHVSRLLAEKVHRQIAHSGAEHTISIIRQKYWIVGVRVIVKQLIKKCILCKLRGAITITQHMANLPAYRFPVGQPCFYNTGVDFFGPFNIKVGRARHKRWGALFTCLGTRAVHLEVAEDLSTDAFINVLTRFISRRGCPKTIYSDCGTNFVGANSLLQQRMKEINVATISDFASKHFIEWKFNPPYAPHFGGVWERLVRTVKRSIKGIIGEQVLTDPQFHTALCEVESIVNSRPLTSNSDDINDLCALTPNHFLLGRAAAILPPGQVLDADITSRKRWRQVQYITKHFWDRFQKEYLPKLTDRKKWQIESNHILKKNSLVAVFNKDALKCDWMLGRIIKCHEGADGITRVVDVKTKNGTIRRPITSIMDLEEIH